MELKSAVDLRVSTGQGSDRDVPPPRVATPGPRLHIVVPSRYLLRTPGIRPNLHFTASY